MISPHGLYNFLRENWQCICLICGFVFIQYKYLNRVYFVCKTKLCLTIPGRQGKYIFTRESFYLQGTLNNINDCKQNYLMKRGAPPDKVLYHLLHIELQGFTSRFDC